MGQAIRISNKLYNEASNSAARSARSAAEQIEHWAELGKKLEERMKTGAQRVKDVIDSLSLGIPKDEPPSIQHEKVDFVFVENPDNSDSVDKLYRDGRRVTGKLIDGKFVTS